MLTQPFAPKKATLRNRPLSLSTGPQSNQASTHLLCHKLSFTNPQLRCFQHDLDECCTGTCFLSRDRLPLSRAEREVFSMLFTCNLQVCSHRRDVAVADVSLWMSSLMHQDLSNSDLTLFTGAQVSLGLPRP